MMCVVCVNRLGILGFPLSGVHAVNQHQKRQHRQQRGSAICMVSELFLIRFGMHSMIETDY